MPHVGLSKEEADSIYQLKKSIEGNAAWETHESGSMNISISLIAEDGTLSK